VICHPPKADAKETIAQLRDLGVHLKVISGDNRAVAATFGHRVGITAPTIVTGSDLRTQRSFFLSRPGNLFLIALSGIALLTMWIPFSPFSATLGFVEPPAKLPGAVLAITLLYGIGMEVVKRLFYRFLASPDGIVHVFRRRRSRRSIWTTYPSCTVTVI
jgi:hypothetical protein